MTQEFQVSVVTVQYYIGIELHAAPRVPVPQPG